MNRSDYFNFIEAKFSTLGYRLALRGGLNILDLNLHSENFYLHFFNLLFGWKLKNLNTVNQNAAGIDLIDTTNKIIIQVSATVTKQKIESALAKKLSKYTGYSFKFISISKNATDLGTQIFSNPHNLVFSPPNDIYDISTILKIINGLHIDQLKEVYEFIKKELKTEPDPEKIESNLTTIINILSKVDWSKVASGHEKVPFEIEEKISYNHLDTARTLIDDYKIYYSRIDKTYTDFDKQGVNKSFSILGGIRKEYLAVCSNNSPDQCFYLIIKNIVQIIRASANYTPIPGEELEMCVGILVVDAFIRCKIFKNPLKT